MIELHKITLIFAGTGIFMLGCLLGWLGCFAVSWLILGKTGKATVNLESAIEDFDEAKRIVPMKDSSKR